jgi:hypothetical protein
MCHQKSLEKSMSRIVILVFAGLFSLSAAAASLTDDMIEPSQEVMRLRVAEIHVSQLVQAVEEYARSIGLRGEYKAKAVRRDILLTSYETPVESDELPRAIYLMRNSKTDCLGIEVRVWDDLQTDAAKEIRQDLMVLLRDMFEPMSDAECGVTF